VERVERVAGVLADSQSGVHQQETQRLEHRIRVVVAAAVLKIHFTLTTISLAQRADRV
jgi:hypothetical protein